MNFLEQLNFELAKFNIPPASAVPLTECTVTRPYMLERAGFDINAKINACMFVMPYYVSDKKTNISHYAKSRDYHLFFDMMSAQVISSLKVSYPDCVIAGFADTSPIDERSAAAKAGLGVIGDNGMLITEKYSSYVFIGEIMSDCKDIPTSAGQIKHCLGCGRCRSVCPMLCGLGECLSHVTQKKGELSEREIQAMKKYNTAWGCDICQECCPYTERAKACGSIYTDIDFFRINRTEHLTSDAVAAMSDTEFSERAYSWRGKKTVMRNLNIIESTENAKSGKEKQAND